MNTKRFLMNACAIATLVNLIVGAMISAKHGYTASYQYAILALLATFTGVTVWLTLVEELRPARNTPPSKMDRIGAYASSIGSIILSVLFWYIGLPQVTGAFILLAITMNIVVFEPYADLKKQLNVALV